MKVTELGSFEINYDFGIEYYLDFVEYPKPHNGLTHLNFPAEGKGSQTIIPTLFEWELGDLSHGRIVHNTTLIGEMCEIGMRPADCIELIAFDIAYPAVTQEAQVIALNRMWMTKAPAIIRLEKVRRIVLAESSRGWVAQTCSFLAIKQSQ